ncbi:hypothetical protein [Halorarum halobium]|uniref:hypothetical protein n=1 Tax=Halorarum halobium TaxID=3075121 RepID=UPI0028A80DA3|nr:hypothetical protein [Halobaculum sp. XH14]
MSPTTAGTTLGLAIELSVLQLRAEPGATDYRGLLFLATFLALAGFILANHGAAAYTLLLWEGGAGVVTWVYVEPVLGGFFFLAAAFQFPLAARLWGDPLRLWPRTRRLVGAVAERAGADS